MAQAVEQLCQSLRAFRPKPGHRLVHDKHLGVHRQRNRDLQLPPLPVRQFGCAHIHLIAQSHPLQSSNGEVSQLRKAQRALEELIWCRLRANNAKQSILQDRVFHRQSRDLKCTCDAQAGAFGAAQLCDISTVQEDLTFVRRQASGDLLDQRRFARAIGSNQSVDFAVPQVERDGVTRFKRAERFADIAGLKHRVSHGPAASHRSDRSARRARKGRSSGGESPDRCAKTRTTRQASAPAR